ncbi:MAG: lysozyme inhibitor LprI family protein [Rhodocyclaceae bacterium]
MQEAQRAWIKFRDANCDFYYDPEGGSLARVSANDCMMSSTARRAKELESLNQ